MTSNPLTEQQLDEKTAAARRDRYAAAMATRDGDSWPTGYEDDERDYRRRADAAIAVADAEQAELRAELAAARRPHTPRLCACGHSYLAHTVPAPHSCFAYGQTCPCEAYRQLPHDEAVSQLKRNQQAAAARAAAETGE